MISIRINLQLHARGECTPPGEHSGQADSQFVNFLVELNSLGLVFFIR
jgi:hypothetical protein